MFILYTIGPVNYGFVNPWANYFQPIPRTRGYGGGQVYSFNAMQSYLNPYAGNQIPYYNYYPYNTNPNLFLNPNVSSPLSSGSSGFNQFSPFGNQFGFNQSNPFGNQFSSNQYSVPLNQMVGLMDGGFNPFSSSSFGFNQGPNPFDMMLGLMDGGFNPLGFSSFGFNQGPNPFDMMLGLMDGSFNQFNPQYTYLYPDFSPTDYVAGQLLSRNHLQIPSDEASIRTIAAA